MPALKARLLMEEKKSRLEKFYIAFAAMLLSLIVFNVVDRLGREVESQMPRKDDVIGEWTLIREDGTTENIEFPSMIRSEKGEIVTIETTIPTDTRDNMWISYYCVANNKLYVDGDLRKSYNRKETGVPGGSVSEVSLFVAINASDGGKKIRIEFDDPQVNNIPFYEVYYGDGLGIIIGILKKTAAVALLALLLLFVAVVVVVIDLTTAVSAGRKPMVTHLAIGAVLASSWIIINSRIFPLVTRTYYVNGTVAFFTLMLMPIPVVVYINKIQKNRHQSIHIGMAILAVCLFIITSILHFTETVSFLSSEIVIEIVLFLLFAIETVTVIMDIRKGHLSEYRLIVVGLGTAIGAAVLEMIQARLNIVDNEGFFLEIGLIVLLICGFIQQLNENQASDRQREQAVAANESKSSFLASMSHEIRTPINSIIGMNEMIMRENRDPQIKEYANQVDRSGKMLLGLINDVLDFSKIEAGKMTILDVPYKSAPLINDLVQLLNERTIAKSLKSGFDIARDIPRELSGDEIHIKQIIVNLISNGVKYTKEGYVTLKVSAEKVKADGMINLKFVVSDNGIGIKKENLETLFDRFTRLDEQRNRSIEGSGLGLSIVKSLVDEMHGTVSVESEYGKGSSFTVVIPQKITDPEPIGDIREAIRKTSEESMDYVEQFHASKAKILIVDDNLVNLRVASELLKRTRVQIDTATGGRECIYKCRDTKYDLILMDHRMPDPDGIETLRLLRQDFAGVNYDTKVIVLTANVFAGIREKYIAEGFVDYLSKPIDSEQLERCIIKHLDPSLIDMDLPEEEHPPDSRKESPASAADAPAMSCSYVNHEMMNSKANSILISALKEDNGEKDRPAKLEKIVKSDVSPKKVETEPKMDDTNAKKTLAERLREVPGMDIDKTIERYGDKDDFLSILFAAVISDGRAKAAEMKRYLEEKDYKDFGIEAHATKSSMATIFATEISERAKKHEFACKEGRFDFVEEDGAAFVEDYIKFLDLVDKTVNG